MTNSNEKTTVDGLQMSQEILGNRVALRPASIADRRLIYEWLALSDLTSTMCGPPQFPEKSVPTWEEFQNGYAQHYFDGSDPELGQCFLIVTDGLPVGQVNYNDISDHEGLRRTELDVWMRAEEYCGRGYGTDAIAVLCRYLFQQLNVQQFMMQPSARNARAIRAYETVGFVRVNLTTQEADRTWGPKDYVDSIFMVKDVSRVVELD